MKQRIGNSVNNKVQTHPIDRCDLSYSNTVLLLYLGLDCCYIIVNVGSSRCYVRFIEGLEISLREYVVSLSIRHGQMFGLYGQESVQQIEI